MHPWGAFVTGAIAGLVFSLQAGVLLNRLPFVMSMCIQVATVTCCHIFTGCHLCWV